VTRQSASNRQRYRFGEFLLDPAARDLRCGGERLTLSPKVFDCITYLIENRGRAIGHDELMAAVWGKADIADVQLRQLMRKVRRTVHDDGDRQMVVRTIPHFGFHWVADTGIEEIQEACPLAHPTRGAVFARVLEAPIGATLLPGSVPTAARIATWACVLAILILPLAADDRELPPNTAAAIARANGDGATEESSRGTLGVLPVELGGQDGADMAWIRLGLMDLIARHLRDATLSVVPSSDIVALDRDRKTDTALASRVRAATVARDLVLPSATRTGERWSVRLDLRDSEGTLRTAEGQSSDVVTAAHDATDRLLALLGKDRVSDFAADPSPPKAQLLQRIEAAMLVDDYSVARLQIESAPPAMRDLPELQLALARVDMVTHKADEASARLTSLLDAVSVEADAVLRARVLTTLAIIHKHESSAIAQLTDAIALLESRDEPGYVAAAYNVRGYIYSITHRYDESLSDYARARTAFALANDALGSARVDNGEAIVDLMRGHAADALPLFERAAQRFERFGALDKLANTLINRISTYLELLRPLDSLVAYQEAEAKLEHYEDAQMLRWLRIQGAQTLAANGRLREARGLLDGVLQTTDPSDIDLLAVASRFRAELDLAAGQPDSAILFARRAIDTMAAAGRGDSESSLASLTLARALRAANQADEASRQTAQLSEWSRSFDKPITLARVRLVEAEQAWSIGEREQAVQRYEEALEFAGKGGTPLDVSEVTRSYGNALLDVRDLGRASGVVGRLGRWTDRDFPSALLQTRLYQALGQREAWQAALNHARKLAGERTIPADLAVPPRAAAVLAERHAPQPKFP
jgi:DNA-binding winged helix-turn-helix (wHTH) protein/tetratricopeptide (TPR) repeat protein